MKTSRELAREWTEIVFNARDSGPTIGLNGLALSLNLLTDFHTAPANGWARDHFMTKETSEIKSLIIRCLEQSKGDDSYRAKLAFSGFTSKQMQEQHGQSGKTRQEILDGYLVHDAKIDRAIDWVKAIKP